MKSFGIETEGFKEIQSAFKDAADNLGENLGKALYDAGSLIEETASYKVPYDTGHLAAHIETRVKEEGGEVVSATIGIHPDVISSQELMYAVYVEFGTGIYAENGQGRKTPWVWKGLGGQYAGWHRTQGMRAQPYLRPAFDECVDDCYDIIDEYVGGACGGVLV